MKLPRHACLYCALLAIIAFTSDAHAQVNHHEHTGSMPVGYHEFRFFGGDGRYYLSHFPMFSSIHAFQYVVEVVLSEEAKQAVAKDEREDVARKRRYQLSPYRKGSVSSVRAEDEEDWVLPDTLQSGKAINGDIFYLEGKDRRTSNGGGTASRATPNDDYVGIETSDSHTLPTFLITLLPSENAMTSSRISTSEIFGSAGSSLSLPHRKISK